MTYLGMFVTGSPMNYGQFENAEYDQLLDESKTAPPEKRFDMLYRAHELLMEEAVYMPIYYYVDINMVKNNITDWENTSRAVWWFGFADITE